MSEQETSYTPGPWEVFDSHSGIYILDSAEQAAICKIEWRLEDEANARLIASAPELLRSLRDILGYMERGNFADNRLVAMKIDARAAIAKAEWSVQR
jgi:hypothetical protein